MELNDGVNLDEALTYERINKLNKRLFGQLKMRFWHIFLHK